MESSGQDKSCLDVQSPFGLTTFHLCVFEFKKLSTLYTGQFLKCFVTCFNILHCQKNI